MGVEPDDGSTAVPNVPHADRYGLATANPAPHTTADADPDTEADADPDAHASTDTAANADTDATTNANSNAAANALAVGVANAGPSTNADRQRHGSAASATSGATPDCGRAGRGRATHYRRGADGISSGGGDRPHAAGCKHYR